MSLKISRTGWLVLTIGILIVLMVTLGLTYQNELKEQGSLNQPLTQAKSVLAKYSNDRLSVQQETLGKRLTILQSAITNNKESLKCSLENILIVDCLYGTARDSSVTITELNLSEESSRKLEDIPFSDLTLIVKAEGTVLDLVTFLANLSADFPTATVQAVKLTNSQAGELQSQPSVSITLTIHSLEG